MLTKEQVHRILTLADHYAQQRYRDSNHGTRDGFEDRKDLVRYLEQLMQPSGVDVPLTEREEAKRARPPCDEEPWVVADDEGLRLRFRTEDAAWRYRNEYTDRLVNPTVTYEPAAAGVPVADECGTCRKALPDGCNTEFEGEQSCALTHGVMASDGAQRVEGRSE